MEPINEEEVAGSFTLPPGVESPDDLRQLGNHHFSNQRYHEALICYDMAIEFLRSEPDENPKELTTHLCNRSACRYKMEDFEAALEDSIEALSLSRGRSVKAYFRMLRAHMSLGQYDKAIAACEKAMKLVENGSQEYNEFQRLLNQVKRKRSEKQVEAPLTSLKNVKSLSFKPSIRDFTLLKTLGEGNFSNVKVCQHKTTNETFALKIISKSEAERLAKRQHPNVYNEINMERRVLCERLNTPSASSKENEEDSQHGKNNVTKCWYAFQDYENLYFLMDLYHGGDLWSQMFYKKKFMVGCPPSMIPSYLHQILSGIEYLHLHGIVHRDLKPENIQMRTNNRIVIIDFGTAKDLLCTDLNGPEFVGTPDYMTPEAVKGQNIAVEGKGASFESDLWAIGAIGYVLYTGETPFSSQSPYLGFLKIARGNLRRKGILAYDDNAWNLISSLMSLRAKDRLGAGSFYIAEENGVKCVKKAGNGYDDIYNHTYFSQFSSDKKKNDSEYRSVPSLVDLSIRACADMVHLDSKNLDLADPGDGSSHDLLRLTSSPKLLKHKANIMQVLERMHLLHNPRVYRRFFATRQEARLEKIRPLSKNYVGLTLQDFPLAEQQKQVDEGIKVVIKFVFLANPLFLVGNNETTDDGQNKEAEEKNVSFLKECIREINKIRPKAVIVSGEGCGHHKRVRKLLSKINESINVIINDGKNFFSICFSRSVQGLIVCKDGLSFASDDDVGEKSSEQKIWLEEELEQSRVSRNSAFGFVNDDPHKLDEKTLAKLARGRLKCIFGTRSSSVGDENESQSFGSSYEENKFILTPEEDNAMEKEEDSDYESDEEKDGWEREPKEAHDMTLLSTHRGCFLVSLKEETGDWKYEHIEVKSK